MMSSGINLVMTVIGFVVSSLFIVFVCTRLICARIHLAASRLSLRSDLNLLERGLQRQEPVGVSNFPTKKFKDEFFKQANDPRCAVCLADYLEEDTLRILPFCGHSFHATCIDIWLYQQSTCPICRESMRENAEKKRVMQMQPMFSSPIRAQYYGMESTVTQSHHCFTDPQYSTRMLVGRHSSPIEEGHFRPEENRPETGERATEADDVQLSKNPNSLCNR